MHFLGKFRTKPEMGRSNYKLDHLCLPTEGICIDIQQDVTCFTFQFAYKPPKVIFTSLVADTVQHLLHSGLIAAEH